MADLAPKFINIISEFTLSDNAFNYELEEWRVNNKYLSIFQYYDENKDGTLQVNELQKIKQDIDSINNDEDKNSLSQKEINSLLFKIFPKQFDHPEGIMEEFLKTIQFNYQNIIERFSDGKIDFSMQQQNGDCWLLSQVRALSSTDWGAKAIKESITYDEKNEKFIIDLKGVNFSCEINYDEIANAKNDPAKPIGDIDMLLLELATEKYFKQEIAAGNMNKDPQNPLNGGPEVGETTMQYLLTGNKGLEIFMHNKKLKKFHRKDNKMLKIAYAENNENANFLVKNAKNFANVHKDKKKIEFLKILSQSNNYAMLVNFYNKENWNNQEDYINLNDQDTFDHQIKHSYQLEKIITDSDGEITDIILINPWNPEVEIHKSLKEFLDQISNITVVNETDNYDEVKKYLKPSWIKVE